VASASTGVRTRRPSPLSSGRIVARRLGVLAAVGLVVWGVWWSPLFELRAEEVSVVMEASLVDPALVQAAIEPFVGTALPRLDLGAVEAAVTAVPGVREATVIRSWAHGLQVEAVERVPVAAIADSGAGYILVDVDGVELAFLDSKPTEVPVVTVPVGEDNARILAAALAVAGALPPELMVRVEAVRAETEDSVTMFLKDGPRVEWGSADDMDLKVGVLRVLLNSEASTVAVIDVSAPTFPVIRER